MKHILSRVSEQLLIFYAHSIWLLRKLVLGFELFSWRIQGRPVWQPHLLKRQIIREYATKYSLRILVETGTFWGDMVNAMKSNFDQIYSIELSSFLNKMAVLRFKDFKTIELLQGDSGVELCNVVNRLRQPALFWLDGHYSGGITAKGIEDTPILKELRYILTSQNSGHVIIIDDARCFGQDPAYPSIETLCTYIKSINSSVDITIQDDCIRITPQQ